MSASNSLALVKSLLGHTEDRSPEQVLNEVRLAAYGATITDIQATRVLCHTALCPGVTCDDCSGKGRDPHSMVQG